MDLDRLWAKSNTVHWIFQARILEWVAISFSRSSSQPRHQSQVSHDLGRRFTVWATGEMRNESQEAELVTAESKDREEQEGTPNWRLQQNKEKNELYVSIEFRGKMTYKFQWLLRLASLDYSAVPQLALRMIRLSHWEYLKLWIYYVVDCREV